MLIPVKFSSVDNNTANCRSMTADPLSCRVDNNIRAVLDGADIVTTGTESVVDLWL